MTQRRLFIIAFLTFFVILSYITSVYDLPTINIRTLSGEADERIASVVDGRIYSGFPITFYHNAYIDFRYPIPRLRIFSLNKCTQKNEYLLVDIHYEGIATPTTIKLSVTSIEGHCPSTYAPASHCFYVAHIFYGDLKQTGGIQKVVVNLGSRKVTLGVKETNKRLEKGLTVCLQPVYYYSQWQNIVLYIEAWKSQGASRFIVFYHSGTKETRRVLEHYQSLGIIELRSWPSFGSLPASIASRYPKMDDSAFIISYFLAMNICILDIKTTLGTVADFDELMVAKNETVLEYVSRELEGTQYIFNASVIDLAEVHRPRSFMDRRESKNADDGALLHFRFDAEAYKSNVEKEFRFFPSNSSMHIENMHNMANEIFNGTLPVFSKNVVDGLNRCTNRIRKMKGVCWSYGGMCKAEMDELYEWAYDQTDGIFLS